MEEKELNINANKSKKKEKSKIRKKKNLFLELIKCIGRAIKNTILFISFCIIYIIIWPFTRCKIKGKENLKNEDEARIFIVNHYQIYGPFSVFMNFPYKNRPWIIDKMMDEKSVEHQMGLMVYNEFKGVPKFLKWIVLKIIKNLAVFCMKMAKGIPVSRDNARLNIKTFRITTEVLEKKQAVMIYPEQDYVSEGVGVFMEGFSHIAKYYYAKTGKKITFYPMFISKKNKTMYIGNPIVYNPDENLNVEKERLSLYLRGEMIAQYEKVEVNNRNKKNKRKNEKRETSEDSLS